MFDVAIIGAGVIGGAVARELSKYNLKTCILEKENDVAMGTSKANSAIIHAGFDAVEGSLKAELNVKGSQMMEELTAELGVKYRNNGSLVIGFDDNDMNHIRELYARGVKNGVKDLEVVGKEKLKELEPNVSNGAVGALYAPTGAIVCPYDLTVALIGNAMDNGVQLFCDFKVENIQNVDGKYVIQSENRKVVKAEYLINCAGLFADKIANMVGDNSFTITPRRGEYVLLDKECGQVVSHTIFRTPTKMGKGILVTPTVDGNTLLGPTSENIDDKCDCSTTQGGLSAAITGAKDSVNNLQLNKCITSFCGLRAVGSTGDFIINSPCQNFINVAGIESPGLSSAPAIAIKVMYMLLEQGLVLEPNLEFNGVRPAMHEFREMSIEKKNEIIKKDKSYGKIICRCEGVSEGEILNAIRTNPKPVDLDGVKRRTRAQMGRCQGGFCTPYIMKLLAKEQGVPLTKITKKGGSSQIVYYELKNGEEQ